MACRELEGVGPRTVPQSRLFGRYFEDFHVGDIYEHRARQDGDLSTIITSSPC